MVLRIHDNTVFTMIVRYDMLLYVTISHSILTYSTCGDSRSADEKSPVNQGFSVTRKYIFQLGGIAPFKGYAVFSYLLASFCSVCGSVGK